ncbi:FAD-dependent oxidoreductase [Bacillus sp. ISL-47]|uniref:NAD(P)/FAD-dependent oxidoreductase n=1 Tax=Bacillus sp. ISL-47 TaxID=2819130 RepID=UPI001BE695CB|nr:FAD-dependent oxidoreductase [Bacillus sp. ISL-47]MBT2686580.1 FAD-dependent oxidoreductase [Bacillus sp. ISL-47]MBT2706972.1 FAD-dependent oxidoreductase [Pseudomonas sp. ISL-84]
METDVLIIGGGPAGLAAAIEIASRGLDVTVVDESSSLGGQLCQQTQLLRPLPSVYQPMRGFELAKILTEQIHDFRAGTLLNHRVIGLYADGSVGLSDEENVFPVKAKKIIVATGAAEKAVAFPKWTLPGIITIGAAQTLVNRDFVMPGKEAVIVGSSDFALDVASQLLEVGVEVKGIIEKNPAAAAREKEKIDALIGRGIPFYLNSFIKEARGNGQVEEIDIEVTRDILTVTADVVCIDGGRSPILDSFYQLGCSFGYEEELGGWVPQYNREFKTDKENIFLAGNAAGISEQGALLLTGMIAGISVCEELQALRSGEAEEIRDALWKELQLLEHKVVWEGRTKHIKNFAAPVLKDQFIS